jgi:acyl dehydratase
MPERIPDLRWVPSPHDPARYAEVSQDASAIHLDDVVARQEGFPGVILHGMHVFGQVISHLDRHAPEGHRLRSVSVRFLDVSVPGKPIEVTFRSDDEELSFEGAQDSRPVLGGGQVAFESTEGRRPK